MALFNWAERFRQTPTCDDILKRVRKTEILYWIFLVLSVCIAIWGYTILKNAPENNLKQHALGLLLAIVGIVNVAVIKLWAHIILTRYFIIWDSKNRIESEINKLEAEDL
jgi:hypothetical protein